MKNYILTIIIAVVVSIVSFIYGTQTNTEHHLNLKTVVGFDVTERGLMLYTDDGNGYYLER